MNTTLTALAAPTGYGPSEFKLIIERNTRRAYSVTLILLLFLAVYSFLRPLIEGWLFPGPKIVKVLVTKVSLDALPPPPSQNEEAPPPPPPTPIPPVTGPAARAGSPVAIPDALLAEDLKDFANTDEIDKASAVGGGNDLDFASNIGEGVNISAREEDPGIDEFVSVERDPKFDEEALWRRVKYPEMARRNGIEGTVLVGALVGKDGKIEKVKILDSDNEILNSAAEKAVKETVCTPAIQNGNPVKVWLRIPIRFRLK
ncbi:MAG: TonB family protein [Ignavibacteria bacterium]|nr:TonB family protein [Ignavibacteria bacterium]